MDAKGRSIDNIVIERFWRTLKYEDIYSSSLDYLTPDEVYYRQANNKCYDARKLLLEVA